MKRLCIVLSAVVICFCCKYTVKAKTIYLAKNEKCTINKEFWISKDTNIVKIKNVKSYKVV